MTRGARPLVKRFWRLRSIVSLLLFAVAGFAVALSITDFSQLELADQNGTGAVVTPQTAASAPGRSEPTRSSARSDSEEPVAASWLEPLNRYRASAGVPAVTDDSTLSHGDFLHSRYIVKNYGGLIGQHVNLGGAMHHEDPAKPWYTADGSAAGLASDVDEMSDPEHSAIPSWAIDGWMSVPFHRLSLLDPHLRRVGYGYYCAGVVCVAALNAQRGVETSPSPPGTIAAPITYPPDGGIIDRSATFDGEWPDPLTSCPGYTLPVGLPITLQLATKVTPLLDRYALTRVDVASTPIAACAFDASSYTNPDQHDQQTGRQVLQYYGAVVLVPRQPLEPGPYQVAVKLGDQNYSWSFAVKP